VGGYAGYYRCVDWPDFEVHTVDGDSNRFQVRCEIYGVRHPLMSSTLYEALDEARAFISLTVYEILNG